MAWLKRVPSDDARYESNELKNPSSYGWAEAESVILGFHSENEGYNVTQGNVGGAIIKSSYGFLSRKRGEA